LAGKKQKALKGDHNKRLRSKDSIGSEATAAWQDIDHVEGDGNVGIPSLKSVQDAKDWVDDGSKL
jgi:hypothetical protein